MVLLQERFDARAQPGTHFFSFQRLPQTSGSDKWVSVTFPRPEQLTEILH